MPILQQKYCKNFLKVASIGLLSKSTTVRNRMDGLEDTYCGAVLMDALEDTYCGADLMDGLEDTYYGADYVRRKITMIKSSTDSIVVLPINCFIPWG
ncbi:hypothetical protein AVEN_253573-1 [Araneus ventricosus]|uniref:Uncharacterized protein n=1 Tax=Araneus ventricosus TaxID=182803 RepID=A0A4Y2VY28_ARAVE|nr:hypothetical protein AVEN_253573-1 [Araneus ventricosus]